MGIDCMYRITGICEFTSWLSSCQKKKKKIRQHVKTKEDKTTSRIYHAYAGSVVLAIKSEFATHKKKNAKFDKWATLNTSPPKERIYHRISSICTSCSTGSLCRPCTTELVNLGTFNIDWSILSWR